MPLNNPHTVGASIFEPDAFLNEWNEESLPQCNDLRSAIIQAFKLKPDNYIYHATASVSLDQVQSAIEHGGANGLHAWYRNGAGEQMPPPPSADITAYTQMFLPTTSTTKALKGFAANAKKGSIRYSVGQHLQSLLTVPSPSSGLTLPNKQKYPEKNPYLDLWVWSCHNLEWAGPTEETALIQSSHHILPVLYHHFGCVCPTYDAISLIHQLAGRGHAKGVKRPIVEIGSGNGYWAYLLRGHGLTVHGVDSGASAWRTMWIGDTIMTDGIEFLKRPPPRLRSELGIGNEKAILLLVYPQVSADFTGKVLRAYDGNTIIVAGTQNSNGFTAFLAETISNWMAREKPDFVKLVQIPLPSFAGKDEALYVFQRKDSTM